MHTSTGRLMAGISKMRVVMLRMKHESGYVEDETAKVAIQ